MRFVLDTNIAVAALNDDGPARARLKEYGRDDVGIPTVVLAELYYGAERSQRRDQNIAKVIDLRRAMRVLSLTEAIARRFGSLRAVLRPRGIVKTDFDLVIAATALEHGATLVSHDGALLDGSIEGLSTVDWLTQSTR